MPRFSRESEEQLDTLHYDLRRVLREAIKYVDFKVLKGFRGKEEQNEAFRTGASKLPWPRGKHNNFPSDAVDIAPWPIDWDNINRFYFVCGFIIGLAQAMGVTLRYGGDWDRDFEITDQTFNDLGHLELMR